MAEEYYPQVGETESETGLDIKTESESYDSQSALLPKNIVGQVEPGNKITLEVVKVYDDEIEVRKVPPSTTETKEPKAMSFDDEMDMMAEGE